MGATGPLLADSGSLPAPSHNLALDHTSPPAAHRPLPISTSLSAAGSSPVPIPSTPVAKKTSLANKTGTQSLYQQCSYALTRLLCIDSMPAFFSLSNSGKPTPRVGVLSSSDGDQDDSDMTRESTVRARQSAGPVHQLWDLLALGVPLCILYNAQPGIEPLQISTSCAEAESKLVNNKYAKRAVALFIMGVSGLIKLGDWKDSPEIFTVSELFENNINGFVKVVNIVLLILERLPESLFPPPPPPSLPSIDQPSYLSTPGMYISLASESMDSLTSPTTESNRFSLPSINSLQANSSKETLVDDTTRNVHIQHVLDAERKYVADVEIMHNYAQQLVQQGILSADIVHHLLPGVSKLLDFGLKFLIEMEGMADCAWEDQRWGLLFIRNEEGFEVYEQYCANYTHASELMAAQEQNLMALSHVINPTGELAMFLMKPIHKIYKYHMQLHDLIKHANKNTYPHYSELEQGIAVAKRIVDQANEIQRKVENRSTVKMLEQRVMDWKGHRLPNFGELVLDNVFLVTKTEIDREYHVFLFENMLLCCKEAVPPGPKKAGLMGKVGKNNSLLLKKQTGGGPMTPSLPPASGRKKKTSLLLKGRIFLNNVTKAISVQPSHSLQVWWHGNEDLEFLTLRCRTEEQLLKWQSNISTIVKDKMARRASERAARAQHPVRTLSANPALSFGPERELSLGFGVEKPAPGSSSKFTSTRLRSTYKQNATPNAESMPTVHEGKEYANENHTREEDFEGQMSRDSATKLTPKGKGTTPGLRMRYASQPSVHASLPPQPNSPPVPRRNGNGSASSRGMLSKEKRGSGSSESSRASSEFSPTNTQSSITPFLDGAVGGGERAFRLSKGVRVTVNYKMDLFQIIVHWDTMFNDLVSNVTRKVRLCGAKGQQDLPLRLKYKNEGGNMISLGSDDDLQMAFDQALTASGRMELWVS